jgi:hypothetical protein
VSLLPRSDSQIEAVRGNAGGALWPPETHSLQPGAELFTKGSVSGIFDSSELLSEAMTTKERNSDHAGFAHPAFPHEPRVKVEDARSIRQSRHNSALNGNSVILDFSKESVAESNCVLKVAIWQTFETSLTVVPEAKLIKKMKPRPVKENVLILPLVRSEKDRAAKDALEGASDSLVIEARARKIEVAQELSEMVKPDHPAFPTERERCDPDGN